MKKPKANPFQLMPRVVVNFSTATQLIRSKKDKLNSRAKLNAAMREYYR